MVCREPPLRSTVGSIAQDKERAMVCRDYRSPAALSRSSFLARVVHWDRILLVVWHGYSV